MSKLFSRFRKNESGATAALIAVVIIGGATTLGSTISEKFTEIAGKVEDAGK
jgi:pilus assembly protein Flp/PilA